VGDEQAQTADVLSVSLREDQTSVAALAVQF